MDKNQIIENMAEIFIKLTYGLDTEVPEQVFKNHKQTMSTIYRLAIQPNVQMADLNSLVTKDFANKNLVNVEYVDNKFATKETLIEDYITRDYATENFVDKTYINTAMVKRDAILEQYATKEYVENKLKELVVELYKGKVNVKT